MKNYKTTTFSIISALLLTILLFSFSKTDEMELTKSEFIENIFPEKMDDNLDYASYNLVDYNTQKSINLSEYKNKIILINFYEPWCSACNKEFYVLDEFAHKYKDRVVVISVSSGEDMEMLNTWQKKWNYKNIKFFIDKENKLTSYFKVSSIPATYLVQKDGAINYKFIGDRNYLSSSFSNYIDLLLSKEK